MADTKWSQFPSATPSNSDEVVGLHSGDNARFSIANIIAAVRNGLANIFVPKTDVGATNGVASLDSTGKVPGTQLDLSGKQDTITANGILKGDGAGVVSAATPGTDYQAPLTAGTDYATPAQLADKAAKADLTSIQTTGTTNTTGAAIPAGAYFYLNGVLHRAKEQIGTNVPFTVNTNCEQVQEGGLNELKAALDDIAFDARFAVVGATGETYAQLFARLFALLDTTNRAALCSTGCLIVRTTRFYVNEYSTNFSNIWLSRTAVQSLKPLTEQIRLSTTASNYYSILDGTSTDLSNNSAAGIVVRAVYSLA